MVDDGTGYEDEDERTPSGKWYNAPSVIVMIILIVAFIFVLAWYPAKEEELVHIKFPALFIAGLFIAVMQARAVTIELKYRSPQAVADNIHSSTSGEPTVKAGMYEAYDLGAIKYGINLPGGDGTLIIPTFFRDPNVGSNISCPGIAQKVPPEKIPWDIQLEVLKSGRCKPPYYVVYMSPSMQKHIPDVSLYVEQIKSYSSMLRFMHDALYNKKVSSIDAWEEFKSRSTSDDRKMIEEAAKSSERKRILES